LDTAGVRFQTISNKNILNILTQHEKYSDSVAKSYYRNASAITICFSLTNRHTFVQAVDLFVKDCLKYEDLLQNTKFYLVGNKADLQNERQVLGREIEVSISFYNQFRYQNKKTISVHSNLIKIYSGSPAY